MTLIELTGPDADYPGSPWLNRQLTLSNADCPMWAKNAANLHLPTTVVIEQVAWSSQRNLLIAFCAEAPRVDDHYLRRWVEVHAMLFGKTLELSP